MMGKHFISGRANIGLFLLLMQFDAAAFFCRPGCCFENTHNGEVIGQGGEVIAGVCPAGEDVGEIGDIIAIGGGVYGYTIITVLYSFYELPAIQRMQVTGSSKYFPIFYSIGPVPGGFDDAGGIGIFQEDGGVVIYFWIDGGLYMAGYRRDGNGGLAMHEPGHEIGAVATEVADGSAAVLYRIGKPVEEIGAAADLFWAFVAVMDDHFPGRADLVCVYHFEDLLVGVVPGGLVVNEDADMILSGEGCDAIGVLHGCCEWFFHHDGDAFGGADLYDAEVFGNSVVGQYRIGMGMADKAGKIVVEEGVGELIGSFIPGDELWIGFDDTGDDHLPVLVLMHDIVDMVVGQAGHPYV